MDVRSDKQRQDQERTHPRNHESDSGIQKNHGETIEPIRACDEERQRTHIEESVQDGYTREKEYRTTKNKMERREPTRPESTGLRGEGRSSVILVTLHDGKSQGK